MTLGGSARLQSLGCGCLRRGGGGGSRPVKRGSDLKCSKRSKLTQASPQTSCLRLSLRQGNLAGAKEAMPVCVCVCVCVCACVCVRAGINLLGLGAGSGEGFAGAHVCWNSEMACDGQGKTRRISPVCLREGSRHVTPKERETSVSGMDFVCVCVCVCVWQEAGQASGWLCVCAPLSGSQTLGPHLLQFG